MRNSAGTGSTSTGRQSTAGAARGGARRRVVAALTVAALVGVTAGTAAQADDLYNTIDGNTAAAALDAQAERMPLAVGGAAGTTSLRLQARHDDGLVACNVSPTRPATFGLRSSNPAVATVGPATVQFTACTTLSSIHEQVVTITPVSAGETTITAYVMSATSPGSFELAPATFVVTVAPPPNNPPTVTVTGVTAGQYAKGSGPTPMCEATDAEDGTSTFAPVIGLALDAAGNPVPLTEDGLGGRLARCSYTDSRGSTAVASASWSIVDPDPPAVRYVLSKPQPASGWYREEVALDWVVVEPESPRSLTKLACDRQWITPDQPATTYTCTATSSGGTTTVTSEPVKKDSTPPTVTATIASQPVVVAGVTWYRGAPDIQWTAEDTLSGVAAGSVRQTVVMAPEGRNLNARTVATDNAGNTGGTSVQYVNVDASAPVVEARLTGAPAYEDGGRAWFKDRATVDVVARDPDVQPLERGSGLAVDPTGSHVVTASGDFTITATDGVGHVGTSNAVPVSVDATAPVATATCPAGKVVKGSTATATWTASDEAGGSGLATAGTGELVLDTASVGRKTVIAPTATDNVGHTSAPASCAYDVVYDYSGFYQPIDNGSLNKVKAGSAVPVKFGLGGDQGLSVLSGAPLVSKVACPSSMTADLLEETAPASSTSGLKYDAVAQQYNYTWKTANNYAGSCQRLTVKLADGTSQTALFQFTK